MSWDEVKNDKEGYIKVRKGDTKALHGRTKKANEDPKAQGYIELKVDDLGFEGGGGPHTHSEYANKTHTHDDYLTDLPDHDHPHTHDEYLTALPDHDHPEYEGGESYDDTEVRGLIADNASDIADNATAIANIQSKGYDDTEVRGLIQDNTDSIAEIQTKGYDDSELRGLVDGKADEDHTHDAPDLTHDHDGTYQPVGDYATTEELTDGLAGKSDDTHTHDTTHDHEEYFLSGATVDADGNPIPLPYANAKLLGDEVDTKADEDHEHPYAADDHNHDAEYKHDHPYAADDHEHDLTHDHDELQAQVDHNEDRINALEHELEALADTREAGEWELVSLLDFDVRGQGQMVLTTDDFTASNQTLSLHSTDTEGVSHGFSRVEVGDYVEIVEEHPTRGVGDYGLYTLTSKNGNDFGLALEQGQGRATTKSHFLVKFFHLQDNIDLAELDARYAQKTHSHNYASSSHTHNYASSSHTHSYASTNHTHDYSASNHTHSVIFRSGTTTNPSLSKGEPFLNTTYKVIYVGT